MYYFSHKYSSKFILYVLSFTFIISCVHKHKFDSDKKVLSEQKMTSILVDIFLMEAYVNEKMPNLNIDSLTVVRQSFYPSVLKYHKVDSFSFYSTFYYYQYHPKEFSELLNKVNTKMTKIKPLDTTIIKQIVVPPKDLDKLTNFKEQEKSMRDEYLKNQAPSKKHNNKSK